MPEAHPRIAIIGAGMTGLTCADRLANAGAQPVIFEKSRGIGGRMATRRAGEAGELSFDHGAQYIRSRQGGFSDLLDRLEKEGSVGLWNAKRRDTSDPDDRPLYVGTPAMNSLLRPLASELDIRLNTHISSILAGGDGWLLSDDNGNLETFDRVVVTVPAIQARNLLSRETEIVEAISKVEIWPCWSLMIALESPVECDFDQWRYVSSEIGWLARNSSKPERGSAECWVVHARPEWSIDNLEREKEDVCEELSAMFKRLMSEATGLEIPAVIYAAAHRWRYAQTGKALAAPFAASSDGTLLVGGDWTLGARVECAYESGTAMAEAVLASIDQVEDFS